MPNGSMEAVGQKGAAQPTTGYNWTSQGHPFKASTLGTVTCARMTRNVRRREFDLYHASSCTRHQRLTYSRLSTKLAQSRLTFINKLFILPLVIQTFASFETEHFFATGKSRRLPPEILKRAAMRLMQLDGVTCIDDLRFPPSNRLEALAHDRAGQWSVRINDQWRVCFRFKNGDAYDVEIVDYH